MGNLDSFEVIKAIDGECVECGEVINGKYRKLPDSVKNSTYGKGKDIDLKKVEGFPLNGTFAVVSEEIADEVGFDKQCVSEYGEWVGFKRLYRRDREKFGIPM